MSPDAPNPVISVKRMSVRRLAMAVASLGTSALVLVQACTSESVSGVDIGSVVVSPSSSTVLEGLRVQFEAVVYDQTGVALPGAVIIWSSDADAVASVDGQGLATGVGTGATTIRASFDGTEATATLTVQPGPDIGVTPASVTLYGGASASAPAPATLRLTNQGGGVLGTLTVAVSYPLGAPVDWLTAALTRSTVPADITLTANSTPLPVGKYRATVTITSSESGNVPVTVPVTLSLTGFSVLESASGTRAAESGATDSLSIVLDAAPTSGVRLVVTSADTSQARVSPAALSFTPSSWAVPQIVTVAAVNDSDVDGDRTTNVTVTVDDASSDVAFRVARDRTVSVTAVDDDAAGFVVAETTGATLVTEARSSDTLTVVLRTRPAANVVITATASDRGEATVAPTTLTFRPVDWDVPRTLIVTGVDDSLVDGGQISTVTIHVDGSRSHVTYQGLPDQLVSVTTQDDDGAGLQITESQGTTVVTEAGSTDVITMALTAQPSGAVSLLVTSADIGEATVAPTTLTFTPADWSTAQPVSVRGVDDALLDGTVSTPVTVSVVDAASASEYGSVVDRTITVTTLDDDGAAFAVTESGGGTAVSESGTSDAFTVVLNAQPTSNVLLRVASGDPAEAVVSPPTLTFTPSDWGQAHSVTVTGVDDDIPDGNQVTTVTVGVDAAASDDAFDAVADRTVLVTTADDDASGFTITSGAAASVGEAAGTALVTVVLNARPTTDVRLTVTGLNPLVVTSAPTALTFTPAAWNTPQSVTLTGVDDDVDDGDQVTTGVVAVDAAASDNDFDAVAPQTFSATAVDDDTAGFTSTGTAGSVVTESGGTNAFTVVLDARPVTNVVLTATSGDTGEATVSPATLTFTSANWNVPLTVTLTGVDDASIDGDQATMVTIAVNDAASDNAFDGVASETFTVTTTDDDAAGFVLANTSSLLVTEAGGTDAFTVVLGVAPMTSVVLTVVSGNAGEVTATPQTLTFTPTSWNAPQTVTLAGVDDTALDGDQQTTITVAVDPAASDAAFDALPSQTATATTQDDDAAGLTLADAAGLAVTEAGGNDTFTVRLGAAPAMQVVLNITSSDPGEVTVSPATLTFTSANWSVPSTVTLVGVDDAIDDGPQQTVVTVVVDIGLSDPAFTGLNASAQVTTTDDDAVGVTVSTNALTVIEGDSTVFTVRLSSEPTSDVVLDVSSLAQAEVSVAPVTLTFTASNWAVPQQVTVTGVDDALVESDRQTRVLIVVDAAESDPAYGSGVSAREVIVTVTDDDGGT